MRCKPIINHGVATVIEGRAKVASQTSGDGRLSRSYGRPVRSGGAGARAAAGSAPAGLVSGTTTPSAMDGFTAPFGRAAGAGIAAYDGRGP